MTTQQEANLFTEFKQYCLTNNLDTNDTNLAAWDAQKGGIILATSGCVTEAEKAAAFEKTYYKQWLARVSGVATELGAAFLATVRKTSPVVHAKDDAGQTVTIPSTTRPRESWTQDEQQYVKDKAERHLEKAIYRAKELGTNEKRFADMLVTAILRCGTSLETLIEYIMESYRKHTAATIVPQQVITEQQTAAND